MTTARNRGHNCLCGDSVYPSSSVRSLALLTGTVIIIFCYFSSALLAATTGPVRRTFGFYLPDAEDSKIVSARTGGPADATVTVMTEPIELTRISQDRKVQHVGELENFNPAFVGLHREQPTRILLWNLEPTQKHDFALLGPDMRVIMYVNLPLFSRCRMCSLSIRRALRLQMPGASAQMVGQFLVLPPVR
jgi:hypothetical protein